jgi:hypothetical protein
MEVRVLLSTLAGLLPLALELVVYTPVAVVEAVFLGMDRAVQAGAVLVEQLVFLALQIQVLVAAVKETVAHRLAAVGLAF